MRCFLQISIVICALLGSLPAFAREQIRIVGSSTVYPFVTIAAEQFGMHGEYRTPIVEATGTGGGFKLFCSGVGDSYPDINNASRKITDSELEMCAKNGIHKPLELAIGFDGIVLANKKNAALFALTKQQIFQALARELPDESGDLRLNQFQKWSDIAPNLPKRPIVIYGPPPTSGTRDAFVELVMEDACKQFPAYVKAYPDEKIRKKKCGMMREDGAYIEAGEDDNLIVQKLLSNTDALGIVGFAFYEENRHKVQAAKVGGVVPTSKSIEDASYGISRSMYVYLKREHKSSVAGLGAFASELISEGAIGDEGYLSLNGLIPLRAERRHEMEMKISDFNTP
jgi:phosphate transport system substrate-binding protein